MCLCASFTNPFGLELSGEEVYPASAALQNAEITFPSIFSNCMKGWLRLVHSPGLLSRCHVMHICALCTHVLILINTIYLIITAALNREYRLTEHNKVYSGLTFSTLASWWTRGHIPVIYISLKNMHKLHKWGGCLSHCFYYQPLSAWSNHGQRHLGIVYYLSKFRFRISQKTFTLFFLSGKKDGNHRPARMLSS